MKLVRNLDPPGRFLEKNPEDGLWYDIGDKKASEKTAQALRDRAATFRKLQNEENAQLTAKMDETRQSKTTLHVESSSSNAGRSQVSVDESSLNIYLRF